MSYLSIDQLISKLQELKDSGTPGDMPAMIPSRDNNGRSGFFQRVEGLQQTKIAKSDFDKQFSLCKGVYSRGVEVLVIS